MEMTISVSLPKKIKHEAFIKDTFVLEVFRIPKLPALNKTNYIVYIV